MRGAAAGAGPQEAVPAASEAGPGGASADGRSPIDAAPAATGGRGPLGPGSSPALAAGGDVGATWAWALPAGSSQRGVITATSSIAHPPPGISPAASETSRKASWTGRPVRAGSIGSSTGPAKGNASFWASPPPRSATQVAPPSGESSTRASSSVARSPSAPSS